MPVMDEFREEREALKHGTLKQKLSYFMDYYKWYVIIAVIALAIVISSVVQRLNRKETALYVCLLNAYTQEAEGYAAGFAEFADVDLDSYNVILDTSMTIRAGEMDENNIASAQRVLLYISAAELDVMISDAETARGYANNDYFYDLREFLTQWQIERYEPYFYYIDMKVVQEWREAMDNDDASYVPSYPDPRKPEEMEQPVPVGIYLDNSEILRGKFYFISDDVILTVLMNTTRPETVRQFIDYVMAEP